MLDVNGLPVIALSAGMAEKSNGLLDVVAVGPAQKLYRFVVKASDNAGTGVVAAAGVEKLNGFLAGSEVYAAASGAPNENGEAAGWGIGAITVHTTTVGTAVAGGTPNKKV